MSARQWTEEQAAAIAARGGSLAVSAAAGSGKTAVLVQRIIGLLTDERNPCDVDELLVVTFSRASAAEMKARISEALGELCRARPEDARLKRQLFRLGGASIGTIHSFCLDLLRENFEALDLPPDFRVAEENEAAALRTECAAAVIERFYKEDEDGGFFNLSRLVSSGRDDRRLTDTLIGFYSDMMSQPFPEQWLSDMRALYETGSFTGSAFEREACAQCAEKLEGAAALLEAALSLAGGVPELYAGYSAGLTAAGTLVRSLRETLRRSGWDALQQQASAAAFPAIGRAKNGVDDRTKEAVRALFDSAKKLFLELKTGLLAFSSTMAEQGLRATAPSLAQLLSLVDAFRQEYAGRKRQEGLVDFADLEQMALSLLVVQQDGRPVPTGRAKDVASRYREILLDEYQDTNRAQDLIFSSISRDGENLFFVGDVKQSIYSFRQAEPSIFLSKLKACAPVGQGWPARVSLSKNFRSGPEVIRFVNEVFSRVMSEQSGEMDYGEEECLKQGGVFPDGADGQTVLLVSETQESGEDAFAAEMRAVAEEIRRLVDGGTPVVENGALRPIRYGDIAILLRTVKDKAAVAERALAALGIPALSGEDGGLLDTPEVSALVSLLQVIGNPLLDVPLASALLSYLYGGTPDDAAALRGPEGTPLYAGLMEKNATPVLRELSGDLERYRALAASGTALDVLNAILEDRMVYTRLAALGDTARRRRNIGLFLSLAESRQAGGGRLSQFVSYLMRLKAGKTRLPCAPPEDTAGSAVRILSIHKSKGLEFPVCFVCDMDKRYNLQDLNEKTLLHRSLGFAAAYVDYEDMSRYDTLSYLAVKGRLRAEALAEEMRVLYVALTRPRQRLYVSLKAAGAEKLFSRVPLAPAGPDGKLPPAVVGGSTSHGGLVLLALKNACPEAFGRLGVLTQEETLWPGCTVRIVHPDRLAETQPDAQPQAFSPDGDTAQRLRAQLALRYPFMEAAGIPGKLSVSELTKSWDALQGFDAHPAFAEGGAATALDRGNATHRVMELADLSALCADSGAELERLAGEGRLSEAEKQAVDRKGLEAFARSALCRLCAGADKLYREYSFLCEMPARLLLDTPSEEPVVVQGVIDCLAVTDSGAVLIDYKTDRTDEAELRRRYEGQLRLYRYAVEKELGLTVSRTVIWSFYLKKEVEL